MLVKYLHYVILESYLFLFARFSLGGSDGRWGGWDWGPGTLRTLPFLGGGALAPQTPQNHKKTSNKTTTKQPKKKYNFKILIRGLKKQPKTTPALPRIGGTRNISNPPKSTKYHSTTPAFHSFTPYLWFHVHDWHQT